MTWTLAARFFIASCFLLPTVGYGADLVVSRTESKVGSVAMDVAVLGGPGEGVQFSALDSAQKQALSLSATAVPVNLRVLVDMSALCHSLQIDRQATDILGLVKRNFPKGTLVSVVGFNNNGIEIFEEQRPIADWKGTTIACKGATLAASYEKALLATFKKPAVAGLPNVVWVMTSGNVGLSKESAALLKQQGASLHLLLHNPILEKEIRPLVDQTASHIGRDAVHFATAAPAAVASLPEQRFQIALTVPGMQTSSRALVSLTASRGGKPIAAENVAVEMAVDPLRRILTWAAYFAGIALMLGAIAYLVRATIRYYRARFCPTCDRRLRFSQPTCLFCHGDEGAYLVGDFNWRDRRKHGQADIVALRAVATEVGTHRRSIVPLIAPAGKRRECLARIVREGDVAYRLESIAAGAAVTVNGYPLKDRRYLASGDVIQIGGREITFLAKRSVKNGQ